MAANSYRRVLATFFLGAVLAACSSTSSGSNDTRSASSQVSPQSTSVVVPSSTSASTSGVVDVRTNAVTVYLAMWADMVEAGKTANYQSARLADHATSQALQVLYQGLLDAHNKKLVIKGQPTFSPSVTGVTPAVNPVAVTLSDCVDGTNWLNYTADGSLQDDTPGGKHRTTATVGRLNGRWLVTHLTVAGVGTCS